MSFASIQDLAERLGTQFDPTDIRALRALEDATALIQAWTNQTFTLTEDDEVALDGTGTRALLLPELPVLEVADVTLLNDDTTMSVLALTDYRLVAQPGILIRVADTAWGTCWPAWPRGYANVLVTYSHGYETIPAAIKAACVQIAARLESSLISAGSSGPITGETIGGYRVDYASGGSSSSSVNSNSGLTDDEMALVKPYRQINLT